MQACKLSIAEAHPSQVVKAVFDPPSQSAALLLADSSCLLFSSLSHNTPPFVIAPSCTDLVFLRLRARRPATAPFSSSSSSSSHRSSSLSEALIKPIGPSFKSATSQDINPVANSAIASSRPGSGDGSLFFLVAMPGKGGSCTDLMAWSCQVSAFMSMPIRLDCREPGDLPPSSHSTSARLDVPHGVSVKVAASVNVLVVYSPSVNKVWVLSAKLSGATVTKSNYVTDDKILLPSESTEMKQESAGIPAFEGASRVGPTSRNYNRARESQNELLTEGRGSLLLIKCAVVDCNGPVFALHVSLRHMLLGQLGGLRVWSLWPLIKGLKSPRKKALEADFTDARKGSWIHKGRVVREGTEPCDCGDVEQKTSARFRGSSAVACVRSGCRWDIRAKSAGLNLSESRNGFYEADGFINGISTWNSGIRGACPDVVKDQAGGRDAFMKQQEEFHTIGTYPHAAKDQGSCSAAFNKEHEETDSSSRCLQGCLEDTLFERNGWKVKKQGAHGPKTENDTSDLQLSLSVPKVADQVALPEDATIRQVRNAILSSDTCNLEDWNSQLIVSQSSMFSSPSGSSHFYYSTSALAPNVFCDNNSGCSLSSSHSLSSASSVHCTISNTSFLSRMGTLCGLHSTNLVKGTKEGDFMSFQGVKTQNNASQVLNGSTIVEQVVSIHGLSAGEFVILDSHGKLHLLTLRHAIPEEISQEQRAFRFSESTMLQPLLFPMKIKLIAVLPVSLQTAATIAYPASRFLWISDGDHTIHIATLPEREVVKDQLEASPCEGVHLNVVKTIFTIERISSLYALSANTVIVFTEASILAYSMVGT